MQYVLPKLKKLLNMICISFRKHMLLLSSMRQRWRPLTTSSADTQAVITTVERHLPHSLCNDDIRYQQRMWTPTSWGGGSHWCGGAEKWFSVYTCTANWAIRAPRATSKNKYMKLLPVPSFNRKTAAAQSLSIWLNLKARIAQANISKHQPDHLLI